MKSKIIIFLILIATSVFAQDTVKSFTKIINYGKPDRADWKCFVIRYGDYIDTICINISKIRLGEGQSRRDNPVIPISRITEDSIMITLKNKIETDYKADLKTLQELQTKIIKEESYLEILQYLIEEKKKN